MANAQRNRVANTTLRITSYSAGTAAAGRLSSRHPASRAERRGDLSPHRLRRAQGRNRRRQPAAGKAPPQQIAGASQPATDRPDRAVQGRRGLVVRPPFEVAEYHRRPIFRRQPGDLGVQGRGQVSLLDDGDRLTGPLERSSGAMLAGTPPRGGLARLQRRPVRHALQPRAREPDSRIRSEPARRTTTRKVAWKASSAACESPSTCRQAVRTIARDGPGGSRKRYSPTHPADSRIARAAPRRSGRRRCPCRTTHGDVNRGPLSLRCPCSALRAGNDAIPILISRRGSSQYAFSRRSQAQRDRTPRRIILRRTILQSVHSQGQWGFSPKSAIASQRTVHRTTVLPVRPIAKAEARRITEFRRPARHARQNPVARPGSSCPVSWRRPSRSERRSRTRRQNYRSIP